MVFARDYIYMLRDKGFDIPEHDRVTLELYLKQYTAHMVQQERERMIYIVEKEYDKKSKELDSPKRCFSQDSNLRPFMTAGKDLIYNHGKDIIKAINQQ